MIVTVGRGAESLSAIKGRAATIIQRSSDAGLDGWVQSLFTLPEWVGQKRLQSSTGTYKERKEAAKQKRREAWEQKEARLASLKTRRAGRPMMGQRRTSFQSWFDPLKDKQLFDDRKARRDGLPWKVKVAAIVERLPLVIWDKPQWLRDYEELKQYLEFFGKEYPKELDWNKIPTEMDRPDVTDEELIALLPEGYTPSPRETEADCSGDVRTLDRKLKTRVFLAVQNNGKWTFPIGTAKESETLLDAAKRATAEAVGTDLALYCPSNCPMAVDTFVYTEEERHKEMNSGYFGEKFFYFRVQRHEGDVEESVMSVDNFAWLDKDEMTSRVKEQNEENLSKLLHYLL